MTETLPYGHLMDLEPENILLPDYAILAYAVCAMEQDSCGWGGWIVEGMLRITSEKHDTMSGHMLLPSDSKQVCPCCGKITFRAFSRRFNIAAIC